MRYRKTYLCICDGQQEKMYLEHVARLVNDFPNKVIKFNVYIDRPYRLKKTYEDYSCAALFDYDFDDVNFKRNIELCDKLNRNERKYGKGKNQRFIYHAYSNVNFDLWLILHKKDFNRPVSRTDAYVNEVRKIYGLGSNEDIKNRETLNRILNQISLIDVKKAIERAEKIKKTKDPKEATKVGSTLIYPNPDFSIHEFLKVVLKDSGDL